MKTINPFLLTDGYKTSHHKMYPEGTEYVYSNWTPRHGKHSNVPNSKGIISFGQQMVMKIITEIFDEGFFKRNLIKDNFDPTQYENKDYKNVIKNKTISEIKKEYSLYLGTEYDTTHIEKLWDLGYLPIEVKSLPEGVFVPYGVPVLTIINTDPEFYWLPNFLETLLSNLLWKPMTSATTAFAYKKLLTKAALETDKDNLEFVDFQGHDFSMRGLSGIDDAILSGLGHATSFKGSDTIPVIYGARNYYNETRFVVGSVPASEHSVMSAGGNEDELNTFRHLMKQYPTGILSIVSDTWNLWDVLTKYLPELKDEILARDGKIVIRPDSGDPVDIICGWENKPYHSFYDNGDKVKYMNNREHFLETIPKHQYKGVVELLWDLFGGTINEQGYKVLDPHIGVIYGDSITLDRAKQITERLKAKGFASTNVVLGIGSYTYEYVTRDTHGFAMKATWAQINGEGVDIFKDPITDDGGKKSAKGLLCIQKHRGTNEYILLNQVSKEQEEESELQTIYKNGKFIKETSLTEIRDNVNNL